MPIDILKKRARDKRYREKKCHDEGYKEKRRLISAKSYAQMKGKTSDRDKRVMRRKARDRMRGIRLSKREKGNPVKLLQQVPNVLCKSASAKEREAKKIRENVKRLRNQTVKMRRIIWKLKKKIQRSKDCNNASTSSTGRTSNRKIELIITSKNETRKILSYHFNMLQRLKSSSNSRRALIKCANEVSKKYKGLAFHLQKYAAVCPKTIKRFSALKRRTSSGEIELFKFYTRDDNSRPTAGKKETVTKSKRKEQKRYLNFSIQFLYEKFLSESLLKVGRTQFYKARPFFVVRPTLHSRDTCLCIVCANTQLLIDALFSINVVQSRDSISILKRMVCNISNEECMYRQCETCKGNIAYDPARVTALRIKYFEWCRAPDPDHDNFVSTRCLEKAESAVGLVNFLQARLNTFAPHAFRINHQYRQIRLVKDTLKDDELLIHVDFSENYVCQWGSEVQAAHFGNRRQVVIHQGVLYRKDLCPQSFVTFSDDLRKTSDSVAAHIYSIVSDFPHCKRLYVISDSPSSQYRNRNTMYLLNDICHQLGIASFDWIFSESGHGKGPADGVGAAVKRKADHVVSHQLQSLQCAEDLLCLVEGLDSKMLAKIVTTAEINVMKNKLPMKLPDMKGILSAHQVYMTEINHIFYRSLSCHCAPLCACFNPTLWNLSSTGVKDAEEPQATTSLEICTEISLDPNNDQEQVYCGVGQPQAAVNDFVTVVYDDLWYLGKVVQVKGEMLDIMFMKQVGQNNL